MPSYKRAATPGGQPAMPADGPISFSLEELLTFVEDLMRVADDLRRYGDEVNAFLIDQVVNRLLDRAFEDGA